jgi:hypothetical protein
VGSVGIGEHLGRQQQILSLLILLYISDHGFRRFIGIFPSPPWLAAAACTYARIAMVLHSFTNTLLGMARGNSTYCYHFSFIPPSSLFFWHVPRWELCLLLLFACFSDLSTNTPYRPYYQGHDNIREIFGGAATAQRPLLFFLCHVLYSKRP